MLKRALSAKNYLNQLVKAATHPLFKKPTTRATPQQATSLKADLSTLEGAIDILIDLKQKRGDDDTNESINETIHTLKKQQVSKITHFFTHKLKLPDVITPLSLFIFATGQLIGKENYSADDLLPQITDLIKTLNKKEISQLVSCADTTSLVFERLQLTGNKVAELQYLLATINVAGETALTEMNTIKINPPKKPKNRDMQHIEKTISAIEHLASNEALFNTLSARLSATHTLKDRHRLIKTINTRVFGNKNSLFEIKENYTQQMAALQKQHKILCFKHAVLQQASKEEIFDSLVTNKDPELVELSISHLFKKHPVYLIQTLTQLLTQTNTKESSNFLQWVAEKSKSPSSLPQQTQTLFATPQKKPSNIPTTSPKQNL